MENQFNHLESIACDECGRAFQRPKGSQRAKCDSCLLYYVYLFVVKITSLVK